MLEARKVSLSQVERDLKNLSLASHVALRKMEGERGTRSKKENIWRFIFHLADLWQQGTGREPTAGYIDVSDPGRYVGEFYQFVVRCAALGKVSISTGDPGGTIVRALKEWRSKQNTGSNN